MQEDVDSYCDIIFIEKPCVPPVYQVIDETIRHIKYDTSTPCEIEQNIRPKDNQRVSTATSVHTNDAAICSHYQYIY